jgi:integrase
MAGLVGEVGSCLLGALDLVGRLFSRAKIDNKVHDLRRTFATLVREASGDEFLAMRFIRDKIPGHSDRYINSPMSHLVEALERYSPHRLIRQKVPR